jgi:hypothetical protein
MTKKEMFRKAVIEAARTEPPKKSVERNPDVLVKRECTHRDCAGLSKCKQARSYGGMDV